MAVSLPTGPRDVRLVARALRLVLSRPAYAAVAVLAAWASLTAFVLAQNLELTRTLIVGGSLPLVDRLILLREQYPFLGTTFGTLEGVAIVLVAALVGANLALLAYHVREHELAAAGGGGSAVGVALGVLGAGCAACGSALLAGALSLVGASGLVLALPLEGLEVSILALVVLGLSTYWVADGMRGGAVAGCPIDVER